MTIAIRDVSDWVVLNDETMGAKQKFWLKAPDGISWLFKVNNRPHAITDIAEKLAAELARLVDVPTCDVELAHRGTQRGSISKSLLNGMSKGTELLEGNRLLHQVHSDYAVAKEFHNPGQTLNRILLALSETDTMPPGELLGNSAIADAVDAFVGYILFDAWIANTDRHHENWVSLVPEKRDISSPRRTTMAPVWATICRTRKS